MQWYKESRTLLQGAWHQVSVHWYERKGHVYVENTEGYLLTATNYRYVVDDNDNLNEWLDFSILRPDNTVTETLLYKTADRFSVSVDSYHFGNLIKYEKWNIQQNLLDIVGKYMKPWLTE